MAWTCVSMGTAKALMHEHLAQVRMHMQRALPTCARATQQSIFKLAAADILTAAYRRAARCSQGCDRSLPGLLEVRNVTKAG